MRLLIALTFTALCVDAQSRIPNLHPYPNASGVLRTFNTNGDGSIDLKNPFFQSLGNNGRSCGSCHKPDQAWSISAEGVRAVFDATGGTDPIFRTNDGSNCDQLIDVTSVDGRRKAYSLLLERGLIRVSLDLPAVREFDVTSVLNPYGCGNPSTVSVYRRPLPSANLRFLSGVMWDGRESTGPGRVISGPSVLLTDLMAQSLDATTGHAQGVGLSTDQQNAIVQFELGLHVAQSEVHGAGQADGAGPEALAAQQFFIGINDPLGGNPSGAKFTTTVMTLFDSWKGEHNPHRAAIVRGQDLFNSKPITITGVGGLNDVTGQPVIVSTCGICHDSPNVGDHSVVAPLNIGVADVNNSLGVTYLPVFTLYNRTTGATVQTTDPGRALISGKWNDIGRFKGPVLRGLAARAPYFHNGSAQTLDEVIDFYNQRFGIGFTAQEKADLVAFLSAL